MPHEQGAEQRAEIEALVVATRVREAYRTGVQDGALTLLFPPPDDDGVHQVYGKRFTVKVEWLDGPPPQHQCDLGGAIARERLTYNGATS